MEAMGKRRVKALFLHQLEAGPGSLKHKYLEASFDVVCPRLNSATWMKRLRVFVGVLLALLFVSWTVIWVVWWLFLRAWFRWWVPTVATVVVAILHGGIFLLGKRLALNCMLREAVSAADEAFAQFKPDIIVGQSFGCVVALHMKLSKGTPLLLLCPVNYLFHGHAGISIEPNLSQFPFVTVVHGTDDTLTPLEDSIKLTNTSKHNSVLEALQMEDHRLMSLGEFELREYVHQTVFKVNPDLANQSMWAVPPTDWPAEVMARSRAVEEA